MTFYEIFGINLRLNYPHRHVISEILPLYTLIKLFYPQNIIPVIIMKHSFQCIIQKCTIGTWRLLHNSTHFKDVYRPKDDSILTIKNQRSKIYDPPSASRRKV